MRTTTNFRLTDESRKILAALSAEWHMSQRAVVEKLLRDADPREKRQVREPAHPVEPERAKRAVATVRRKTGVADPDKLAAFQRKMGKK